MKKKSLHVLDALVVNRVIAKLKYPVNEDDKCKRVVMTKMVKVALPVPIDGCHMYFREVLFLKVNGKSIIAVLGIGQEISGSRQQTKLKHLDECQSMIGFIPYTTQKAACVVVPRLEKDKASKSNVQTIRVTTPKLTEDAESRIAGDLHDKGQNCLYVHFIGGRLSDKSFIGQGMMEAVAESLKEAFEKILSLNGIVEYDAGNFVGMIFEKLKILSSRPR